MKEQRLNYESDDTDAKKGYHYSLKKKKNQNYTFNTDIIILCTYVHI